MSELTEQSGTRYIAAYQRDIRGIFRAFWNGSVDFDQFFDLMDGGIRAGLTQVWYAGALACGIQPAELSPTERSALNIKIVNENTHIFGVAEFIEQNSKANGGKFATILPRAALWGQRADDVYNEAQVMACGDKKLKWVLDPSKDNCKTCLRLNNKVKRASYWERVGVRPQNPPNPYLECQGWNCGCMLNQTDDPLSRGPLPSLP